MFWCWRKCWLMVLLLSKKYQNICFRHTFAKFTIIWLNHRVREVFLRCTMRRTIALLVIQNYAKFFQSKWIKWVCGISWCAVMKLMSVPMECMQYFLAWRHRFLRRLNCDAENSNRRSKSRMTFCRIKYKDCAFPGGESLHENSSYEANATMCTFPNAKLNSPYWKCILRCCNKFPSLKVLKE